MIMMPRKTFAAALILAAGLSTNVLAQDKIDSGQRPPQDAQAEPAKAPERCTSEKSGFRVLNGVNTFYVEVTSACEKQ